MNLKDEYAEATADVATQQTRVKVAERALEMAEAGLRAARLNERRAKRAFLADARGEAPKLQAAK